MSEIRTRGLSSEEVAQRQADGRVNTLPPRTGKSVADIIRSNVFTRINAILFVLLVMVLSTGSWINTAFGLLIVVNSGIGMIQEFRAKRTLESLSLLGEERPRVWRDSVLHTLTQEELVLDDVVQLGAGNQIVVDGEVLTTDYLSVDESMLTGESDAVRKQPGDEILSGSFVVSGTGTFRVAKVGAESYAARLTAEASKFTLAKSQLQAGINTILKYITWVLIPVALLTVFSQVTSGNDDWRDVILEITGALVPMVPEGLVLITSTAFALGVIRLGKRKCLVQELPAIEGLARVDIVCADKTGTLTENRLEFGRTECVADLSQTECENVMAQLAAADNDPNSTMQAIVEAFPLGGDGWKITGRQPFTSANKWSGITFDGHGNWILGAPDVLSPGEIAERAERISSEGLRVLLLAKCDMVVDDESAPGVVTPVALLVFEQKIRPDAGDTLEYFEEQNVEVKVISGDNAASVGAVTHRLGIDSGAPIDARSMDAETAEFASTVETHRVFGRVRPDQKRAMVQALQANGHTVAMTGDGVNDVLALKDADIGVAMGSGSSATRSVAKIVLLDDRFATLPYVVAEGRRVIGNIERVANLFLTKTIYSAMLAILVIVCQVPFPFQPIHVTITGWFTIGIPAFLLSLPPNNNRARTGFVRRVLGFAFPAGIIVGASAFAAYLFVSGGNVPDEHVQQSTAALLALIIPSSWVLACVARPWNPWKIALVILPLIGYSIIFNWNVTQDLFILDSSNTTMMVQASIIGLIGAVLVEALWWIQKKRSGQPTIFWRNEPIFARD